MFNKIISLLFCLAFVNGQASEFCSHPALQQEIHDMAKVDQEVRTTCPEFKNEAYWQAVRDVDVRHVKSIKTIVREYGWPTISLVGVDGSHLFWLLVQHTPDFELKKECLVLLEEAVAKQEASAIDFAYLMDRVRVSEGEKQLYGTQFHILDGELVLDPIEDEEMVDLRRQKVGMKPLQEYLDFARGRYQDVKQCNN